MSNNIKLIDQRIKLGRTQVKENKTVLADKSYFDTARAYIQSKYLTTPKNPIRN